MDDRRRNIAVGVTVLIALSGLALLIMMFGEIPDFLRGGYQIHIPLPSAGGVDVGSDVRLMGKQIGTVREVRFGEDPRAGVIVTCYIEEGVRIPSNVSAVVGQTGLVGRAHISLRPGPVAADPGEVTWIEPGMTLPMGTVPIIGLLPQELTDQLMSAADGFASLSELANNINDLLAPLGEPVATTGPDGEVITTSRIGHTFERLDEALTGLAGIVGDANNQQNLAESLANLREATDQANQTFQQIRQLSENAEQTRQQLDTTLASVDQLSVSAREDLHRLTGRLVDQADNLGELIASLNRLTTQAAEGEGSLGLLINDPRLYNNLLDSADRLSQTLDELSETLRTWREEGVPLQLR